MDLNEPDIDARVLSALSTAVARTPPPDLRDRTLAAARAARRPGRASDDTADPVAVYFRQLNAYDDALDHVDDWTARTEAEWSVRDLLAHSIEIERYFGARLGLWPFEVRGPEHDHRAMTEPAVAAANGIEVSELVTTWRSTANAIREHLSLHAPPNTVRFHALDMAIGDCLALRAFELWTHTDDIHRSQLQPLTTPPDADLAVLANTAVGLIALGMAIRGVSRPNDTMRLVLTGPGGGTWVEGLSRDAPEEPTIIVVADIVEFCRMAAQRILVDDLDALVDGDVDTARSILVGASAFAA